MLDNSWIVVNVNTFSFRALGSDYSFRSRAFVLDFTFEVYRFTILGSMLSFSGLRLRRLFSIICLD